MSDLPSPASPLPTSPADLDADLILARRIAQAQADARGADAPATMRTYGVVARA